MTDPGAARGNQTYTPHGQCVCGHSEIVHLYVRNRGRGGCTHADRDAVCGCRRFRWAIADG